MGVFDFLYGSLLSNEGPRFPGDFVPDLKNLEWNITTTAVTSSGYTYLNVSFNIV
jgi:hypothetical protein